MISNYPTHGKHGIKLKQRLKSQVASLENSVFPNTTINDTYFIIKRPNK